MKKGETAATAIAMAQVVTILPVAHHVAPVSPHPNMSDTDSMRHARRVITSGFLYRLLIRFMRHPVIMAIATGAVIANGRL